MLQNFLRTFILLLIFEPSLSAQEFSLGIKLIKNEKYNEAKKFFSSFLNSSASAHAYFYLGQIMFEQDRLDSAKLFFNQGIKRDSSVVLNYAGMVKVDLAQNNLNSAELNESKAIQLNDDKSGMVYLILAEAYLIPQIKNYEKATQFINKAIIINPKYVEGYLELGKVYLNRGNGSEAIKNFEMALKIDEDNPEAITLKAKVYILINNYDEAIRLLKEVIAKDSTYSTAYNLLAETYASLKDYDKASAYFEKYLNASENTPEKLKRYAQILYINKDYQRAIKILENSENAEKDIVSSTRILAYSFLRLNDIEKCKQYFQKLFELPSVEYLPSDYENYADLLSSTGNDSLAIQFLFKIVDNDSNRKDIWSKISVLSFKEKNWEGVINALEKKKTLTTQEYFDLGRAYIFKGDRLINDLMERLNLNFSLSDEQKIKLRTALLYYQKDLRDSNSDSVKSASAITRLVQSIESFITPNQKSKWVSTKSMWIELVRKELGLDYAMADSALAILTEKAPNLPVAYIWRARVNTNFDPESVGGFAKPFYEKFIELVGDDSGKYKKDLVEAYSYLGYYYYLQNDIAKSKNFWVQVLLLDPENKQAKDVVKQLK
ncbi:MAG: hypothetical protein AMXMBFR50_25790 [Ignavibacterium album]